MVTVVEVAKEKQVSRQAVYDALEAGKLRYRRAGNTYLIYPESVEAWTPQHRGPKPKHKEKDESP